MKMFSQYNPPEAKTFVSENPTKTQQHFKNDVDINQIIAKAQLTGVMPQGDRQPTYGDFSNIGSYAEAQNAILAAQEQFMALPAKLRQRFQNNPGALLAFLENPENREEAVSLGLIDPPPSPAPTGPIEPTTGPVPPVPPATSAPSPS